MFRILQIQSNLLAYLFQRLMLYFQSMDYLSFSSFTFFNPLPDLWTELQLQRELLISVINSLIQLVILTLFYVIEDSLYLEGYIKRYTADLPGFIF